MKTISETLTVRRNFKQAQLLPVLTPEMTVIPGSIAAFPGVWPRALPARTSRPAARRPAAHRLPVPHTTDSVAERMLLGLLALSAAAALGYALVMAFKLSPNWPLFNAWVAHVLG